MTIFARKAQLIAGLETTYGVAGSPVPKGSTDSMLTVGVTINPYTGPVVSRGFDRATLGNQSVINTNPGSEITYGVEFAGSGTPATAPKWARLIKACGFAETQNSPTSGGWTYKPLSTSFPSLSQYLEIDGFMHEQLGARGNFGFTLARGQIPVMNFRFMGKYTKPYAGAHSGVSTTAFQSPVAVTNENTPTFTFSGKSFKAESFSFDIGNSITHRNVINGNEVMITDRAATGTFLIETPDLDDSPSVNLFNYVESHGGVVTGAFSLVHGTSSGGIITISAPAVQLSTVTYGNSDGIHTSSIQALFIPSSGNDEISINVK